MYSLYEALSLLPMMRRERSRIGSMSVLSELRRRKLNITLLKEKHVTYRDERSSTVHPLHKHVGVEGETCFLEKRPLHSFSQEERCLA